MKRIFRLWMTKFCYLASLLCFMFLYTVNLSAQDPKKNLGNEPLSYLKTLKPGDPIPDSIWNMPLVLHSFDDKSKKVQLSDYKGKVILFDFWSTACVACIEGIPKLEMIQNRFKDEVVILMVNSKRNKDSPKTIKARFKKYKEDFNYVPALSTLLDDTVFTQLFQHNVLPTMAVINSKGEFVSTTVDGLSDQNIKEWIKGVKGNIENTGYYRNVGAVGRGGGRPLFDTVSTDYYSAFAKERAGFLDSYPNYIYRNGTTYLRIGNQRLSFLLEHAYPFEMKGFSVRDAYYGPGLGLDFKIHLIGNGKKNGRFWYEFFSRDSVTRNEFREIYQRDFKQHFKIVVERRQDSVEFYRVSFSPEFENLKTRHKIRIFRGTSVEDETYAQRAAIYNIISGLSYAFEVPIVMDRSEERTLVDIIIPAGFVYRSEKEKLDFLRSKGVILIRVKEYREYPYIFLLK